MKKVYFQDLIFLRDKGQIFGGPACNRIQAAFLLQEMKCKGKSKGGSPSLHKPSTSKLSILTCSPAPTVARTGKIFAKAKLHRSTAH